MKEIKVLGTGCANCKRTFALIDEVAGTNAIPVALSKVEDIQTIMSYGVLSTPAVVIDGRVVHAGGVPGRAAVVAWLTGN